MAPPTLVSGTRIIAKVATVSKINNGSVRSITNCSTEIGLIIAKTPITIRMLAILDPITLPTAISLCPIRAAETVPANSGRLVPTATTVFQAPTGHGCARSGSKALTLET